MLDGKSSGICILATNCRKTDAADIDTSYIHRFVDNWRSVIVMKDYRIYRAVQLN